MPRRPTPADAQASAARARALLAASGAHVTNQHTVSRALSRHFAEPDGRGQRVIGVHDLRYGPTKPTGPNGVGVVRNFLRVDSAQAEQLWQQVERDIPAAVSAAASPAVLGQPQHLATLRGAIALHFARSRAVADTLARIHQDATTAGVEALAVAHADDLDAAFRAQHGLHLAGADGRLYYATRLVAPTIELLESGAWERVRVEELFNDARDRADAMDIEIVVADDGNEFLLGDAPAVTSRVGAAVPGSLGGVAWDDAERIVMPLTPRLAISLGRSAGHRIAAPGEVDQLNTWQVQAAHERIYHRPGANFTPWIEQVRPRRVKGAAMTTAANGPGQARQPSV